MEVDDVEEDMISDDEIEDIGVEEKKRKFFNPVEEARTAIAVFNTNSVFIKKEMIIIRNRLYGSDRDATGGLVDELNEHLNDSRLSQLDSTKCMKEYKDLQHQFSLQQIKLLNLSGDTFLSLKVVVTKLINLVNKLELDAQKYNVNEFRRLNDVIADYKKMGSIKDTMLKEKEQIIGHKNNEFIFPSIKPVSPTNPKKVIGFLNSDNTINYEVVRSLVYDLIENGERFSSYILKDQGVDPSLLNGMLKEDVTKGIIEKIDSNHIGSLYKFVKKPTSEMNEA